jgi:hypothetical protein
MAPKPYNFFSSYSIRVSSKNRNPSPPERREHKKDVDDRTGETPSRTEDIGILNGLYTVDPDTHGACSCLYSLRSCLRAGEKVLQVPPSSSILKIWTTRQNSVITRKYGMYSLPPLIGFNLKLKKFEVRKSPHRVYQVLVQFHLESN